VNQATLQDGIIMVTQAGDQDYQSVMSLNKEVQRLSKGLPEIRVFVDYHGVTKLSIGARRAGLETTKMIKFDKMAFFGTSPYFAGVINLLARSVGKKDSVYFAKTRQEALAWLR
jgi:hypothetical protein